MYNKDKHYKVTDIEWDANQAQKVIGEITLDAVQTFDPESNWPVHPMDGIFGSDLYMGATGILWSLCYLDQVGAAKNDFAIEPLLEEQLENNPEWFKTGPHPESSSYLFGELSILMLQYKISQNKAVLEEIYRNIRHNESQPLRELMWGVAGTMLAANFMYETTSESRWQKTFLSQTDRLLDEWESIPDIGYLWSPDLYGDTKRYLGPVHGFAGNVIPLIKGQKLLPEGKFELICSRVMETVVNTAVVDTKHANWPAVYGGRGSVTNQHLLQHCHGAPGMINALSEMPAGINIEFDQVLEKAGELTWLAGPLKKGSNLCHGTGGNGYAFLKLYQRTQNELWLKRAQVFAMHAIQQYEYSKKLYQQGRYSLWTGDLGLAVYLWDCIQEQAQFPTIDVF